MPNMWGPSKTKNIKPKFIVTGSMCSEPDRLVDVIKLLGKVLNCSVDDEHIALKRDGERVSIYFGDIEWFVFDESMHNTQKQVGAPQVNGSEVKALAIPHKSKYRMPKYETPLTTINENTLIQCNKFDEAMLRCIAKWNETYPTHKIEIPENLMAIAKRYMPEESVATGLIKPRSKSYRHSVMSLFKLRSKTKAKKDRVASFHSDNSDSSTQDDGDNNSVKLGPKSPRRGF